MDALKVCRNLKSHPNTRNVPVIFLSALSDTKEKVHGFGFGRRGFRHPNRINASELLPECILTWKSIACVTIWREMVEERSGKLGESGEKKLRASLDDLITAHAQLRHSWCTPSRTWSG